jgi:hypothetical protein
MGATYTRQSTYTDGDTITAAHTNDEFDQLLATFATSTGHTHDGTTAEGGPITKLLGNALTFGAGTAGTDITVTYDGESNDGVMKWMEDEDYFEFSDDILIASTEKLQFRDTAIYINSSTDGQLDLVADTEIQIAATTIDMNGAVDISGNLGIGGNLTVTGTTTFNGGTMTLGDAATDNVVFGADVNSSIIPNTDSTFDLGSSGQEWRDIYIDGTAYIDTLDLNGTAITSTAAELNILDGVTSTATELNALDGITAVVGELNALDIGGTAIGTAVASKAVILDANKDYTGIRNLTLAGDLTISGDDLTMGTNTDGHILVADGTNFNPKAVGDLSEISTIASDDVFLAVDTSGGGLKKVTRSAVVAGLATSSAISNVSEDDTPQLGGNLDMNGSDIVTTSNATIDLAPNGTGTVVVRGNTNSGRIVFNCESNSHGQTVASQPHSATVTNTMLLPAGASSTLVSLVSADTLTNKTLTAPTMTGTSIMADLDISGDVDVDGTLEADAITVNGTALATVIAGTTVTNATNSAHVLVTDNESTNEENLIAFVEGATSSTGNVGLEMDGNFAYNPSTGTVSATIFKGNIDAVDGDFDGTLEADAITIGGTAVGSIFSPIAGGTGILTTGALDTGSITSGFGTINNGASAITTTGAVGTGALTAGGLVTANADMLIGGTTPTLTIGDAGAEDAKIVFDGNAQDFHIGLDDTTDDLVIGLGSALGTTTAISIDENVLVTVADDVSVVGRAFSPTLTTNLGSAINLALGNNFLITTTGDVVLTFTNQIAGQSGTMKFVNDSDRAVTAHTNVAISEADLATISATGTYMVSYFVTASAAANTILVSASAILT